MIENLVCWKCGASLASLPQPLARLAECPACETELHVCRQCEFYDTRVAKSCREPVAEEVKEKDRANFCDYFRPSPDAYEPPDTAAAAGARSELEALFGEAPDEPDAAAARRELDALFGGDDDA